LRRYTSEDEEGVAKPETRFVGESEVEKTGGAVQVQGLTLVHFSAQLEPCLSQENTLHTLNTP
jgi:hypothetical protein